MLDWQASWDRCRTRRRATKAALRYDTSSQKIVEYLLSQQKEQNDVGRPRSVFHRTESSSAV